MSRHLTLTLGIALALAHLITWQPSVARAADGPPTAKEAELIALLQSDREPADKALACKQLAVHGSPACVPELARLLENEQLASWARIPLEAIPGPEADAALRQAAERLKGKLLIGVINSLGVRRDASAVELLSGRLADTDAEVASSAAVALGKIGNGPATQSLTQALSKTSGAVKSAVAEGIILCAELAMREGRDAEATQLYDSVRSADVPKTRVVEATRGAILSRKQEGVALLIETLGSTDRQLFQIALSTAREMPPGAVDKALAQSVSSAAPERAALIIVAMADRPQSVDVTALIDSARQGPKPVRLAAIAALGRVGNASCLETLTTAALDGDSQLSEAGRAALAQLPDPRVNEELVARLEKADGQSLALLIEAVGIRRVQAVPTLLKAADHSEPSIRAAALSALGTTIPQQELRKLIERAVAPKHESDRSAALAALKAACIRMPDREGCASELSMALSRAPVSVKTELLQVLGLVGGTKALATIAEGAKSSDEQLQDVSSRILGEWSTIDAAPVLLDLAKSAPGAKYQTRALRGYLRIARQFVMTESERVAMCEKALSMVEQTAEKKLVVEILKRYPSAGTLRLAVRLADDPAVKAEATEATLVIAQKLGGNNAQVAEVIAKIGLTKVKLEIVRAEYGAGSQVRDVTGLLRKQAADSPLVSLPSASFNEAFGGDPAPGVVKQLRVQYRMNGKVGEAAFAENATIILPLPK